MTIRHDLSFANYLAMDAISAHGLMQMERSPAHFMQSQQAPHSPTPAQALGTLTHLCVLEHDAYQRLVHVAPNVDRRTKAGKEADQAFRDALADTPDAIVALEEQDAKARAMREAVMAQPFARALFDDGAAEVSMLWERDGVSCKARADWISDSHEVLIDLKTAIDASERGFGKAAGNFKYHLQAAWYTDAAIDCDLGTRAFIFIAVEPEPPYAVGLYQLDEVAIHAGRVRYQRAFDTYRQCVQSGQWPGYGREIQTIEIPKWAL